MRDFGESFSEHQGVTLSCRNIAPGLTLHDLAMVFENAKKKARPGDEFAGDPSRWPDVRGITAVVDAMNAAYADAIATAVRMERDALAARPKARARAEGIAKPGGSE